MNLSSVFMLYGLVLAGSGLYGFMATGAKSALISGGVSGILMLIVGFLNKPGSIFKGIGTLMTVLLTGVFVWRMMIAMPDPAKATATMLLGVMAAAGFLVLFFIAKSKE